MMKSLFGQILVVVLSICLSCVNAARGADEVKTVQVIQKTTPTGETFSAIVLKADKLERPVVAHDHLILMDTSASQVGEHRTQAINVLKALLKALPGDDRVRLFAVDVHADSLDESFSRPQGKEVEESLEALSLRVPLGATNMEAALRTVLAASSNRPTDITYIGDGMSTADLIELPELRALVGELRRRRVPVHSFGVGPKLNMMLLGVLAHQTGGFVSFDARTEVAGATAGSGKTKSAKLKMDLARATASASEKAETQGRQLAGALQVPVFFPTELRFSAAEITLLPGESLPLRSDRETIYLAAARLPEHTRLVLSDSVGGETLEWNLPAAVEQPATTFLPPFTRLVQSNSGLTNSLAGLTLFQLAQADFSDTYDQSSNSK